MNPWARSLARAAPLLPLALLCACRTHATAQECRAMTDRYLDLALKEVPGSSALSPPQAAAVREVQRGLKRAEPSYRRVEDDCASITPAEVTCAGGATSTGAWESCVHSGDAR
jgi:hypothetical protein